MRAINSYLTVSYLLAFAMSAIHYAIARLRATPQDYANDNVALPTEIEKLSTPSSAKWVEDARIVATRIFDERGEVTIDDMWAEFPPPDGVDGRIMFSVFPRSEWEVVEYRVSKRKVNHGRQVAVWCRKSAGKVMV